MQPRTPITTQARAKNAQRRAALRRVRLIRIGCLGLGVGIVLGLFFRLPVFRITTIKTEGNQLIKTNELIDVAWEELAGDHMLVIPNDHIFFMNRRALHDVLSDQFPRINDLSIERGNLRTLVLVIKERPHAFLWCADGALMQCYFADDHGLLFAKAPYFSGAVFLTFKGGDVPADNPIDTHILNDEDEFETLIKFIHIFDDNGYQITRVGIGALKEYTLSVSHINNVRTPEADILVTTRIEPETALRNISLATGTDRFKELFLAKPASLDYIDARLTEKVFYKFTTSGAPTPAVATPAH